MKVFVLGGDGFCGWPCAVNLADAGHDVLIVDNLSRRKIDIDLGVESLKFLFLEFVLECKYLLLNLRKIY